MTRIEVSGKTYLAALDPAATGAHEEGLVAVERRRVGQGVEAKAAATGDHKATRAALRGEWDTGERAWASLADSPAPWTCVVQDDALPIDGFRQHLENVTAAMTARTACSLYVGTGAPRHASAPRRGRGGPCRRVLAGLRRPAVGSRSHAPH